MRVVRGAVKISVGAYAPTSPHAMPPLFTDYLTEEKLESAEPKTLKHFRMGYFQTFIDLHLHTKIQNNRGN